MSIAVAATGAMKLTSATFASMGSAENGPTSAWHFDEAATVMFSHAGQRADACGVIYYSRGWDHTGGFSYLHRDIPLYHSRDAALAPFANYFVAPRGAAGIPSTYTIVDSVGPFTLLRRPGTCAPKPAWYSRDSER